MGGGPVPRARADRRDGASALASTFEYFASEVFERVDPGVRRVLLEIALLETPTAELVLRATGNAEAPRVLATLARRGLFTVRHEREHPAFELHGLFREFLLARGTQELPAGRADAVRRAAADALAGGGSPADAEAAIALFGQAEDWSAMARLVGREAGALLRQGRAETVARSIEALPAAVRAAEPWLLHWEGVAVLPREPARARDRLREALAAFEERAMRPERGCRGPRSSRAWCSSGRTCACSGRRSTTMTASPRGSPSRRPRSRRASRPRRSRPLRSTSPTTRRTGRGRARCAASRSARRTPRSASRPGRCSSRTRRSSSARLSGTGRSSRRSSASRAAPARPDPR